MEALTAVAVAGLTVYDMAKAIDKNMTITEITLVSKEKEQRHEGGRPDGLRPRLARRGGGRAAATRSRSSFSRTGSRWCAGSCRTSATRSPHAIVDLAHDSALVITTGGTGLAARDVTPEATRSVLEREAPGIAEAIRADSIAKTPHGLLSRGVAGTVGSTLVVNLAGSPGACRDGYAVLRPALPHALKLLADQTTATDHVHT